MGFAYQIGDVVNVNGTRGVVLSVAYGKVWVAPVEGGRRIAAFPHEVRIYAITLPSPDANVERCPNCGNIFNIDSNCIQCV